MPVTPSYVRVAPDSTGKKVNNVQHTTAAGVVQTQVTVNGDPEDPLAIAKVTNAKVPIGSYAAAVRHVTPSFDSGIDTLPATVAIVAPDTIDVQKVFFFNLTDQVRRVTLTDGDGVLYLDGFELQPREPRLLDFGGMTFANGVQWFADAASAVQGQLKGDE